MPPSDDLVTRTRLFMLLPSNIGTYLLASLIHTFIEYARLPCVTYVAPGIALFGHMPPEDESNGY